MGEGPYRGVFAFVALASLVMVVWGYSGAPFEPVYSPPSWGRHAAMGLVPVALVLFAAANMPTHIRAVVQHPMLLGLLVWALAHLAANGDLRSVALFGTFAGFAVVAAVSAVRAGSGRPTTSRRASRSTRRRSCPAPSSPGSSRTSTPPSSACR